MRTIFVRAALAAACLIVTSSLLSADADAEAPCVAIYVGAKGVCFSTDGHINNRDKREPEEAVRLDKKDLDALINSLIAAQLEKEPEGERLPPASKGVPPQTFAIIVTRAGKTIERRFCYVKDSGVPEKFLKCFDALGEKAKTQTTREFLKLNRD